MMGLMKQVAGWLWGNTPWWIKGVLALVVLPNLIINAVIAYFYGVPWQDNRIHATIHTYEEKRDDQIARILDRQAWNYQSTTDSIKRIEQHQGIMYQALLNRHNP